MKATISFAISLMFFASSFCQQKTAQHSTKENYLHNSKVLSTIGFVFLGTGVLLEAGGLIFFPNRNINPYQPRPNLGLLVFELAGLSSASTSVPFFIVAYHFKRKAIAITMGYQKNVLLRQRTIAQISQPAITLKFTF